MVIVVMYFVFFSLVYISNNCLYLVHIIYIISRIVLTLLLYFWYFMLMCQLTYLVLMLWFCRVQGIMASTSDPFWQYDFDDAYFDSNNKDMDIDSCGDDMDVGGYDADMDLGGCDANMDISVDTDSNYDIEEEEFWFVFSLVGEMVAYFQRHYNKCLMRTSILSGKDYMAEVKDGNPTNCHDMFRMTLDLFYHLVDELKHHGYLKEGKWCVYVQESMAIFLYIIGHNTWMRLVGDRFQHATKTIDCKFCRVLKAVHTYGQHLIKPDPNVVGLPEHLQENNKYNPWFEVNHFIK